MRSTEADQRLKVAVLGISPDAQELAVRIGSPAIAWLRRQMQHEDPQIRLTAFYCLMRIGSPRILDACVDALDDNYLPIRARAIREISERGNSTFVEALLKAHAKWNDYYTRYHLALAIGQLDGLRRSVTELKRRWELETNPDAEEGLIVALARMRDEDAQREFVRRMLASFRQSYNSERNVLPIRGPLRFLEYVKYIDQRSVLKALTILLDDQTPLIHVGFGLGYDCSFDLRTCDVFVTLAASLSRRRFTFPTAPGRIYDELERAEVRHYLQNLEDSTVNLGQAEALPRGVVTRQFQQTLRRGSVGTRKTLASALNRARTIEQLSPAHLFVRLCSFDADLVLRTLKTVVDLKSLLETARTSAWENREPGQIFTLLKLAGAIAPSGAPITTRHLLAALLLDGTNEISRYLRKQKVDIRGLVEKRFADVFWGLPGFAGSQSRTAELKARTWLLELVCDQGYTYVMDGVLNVRSTLYPGRIYRIYHDARTEIFEHGRIIGHACIHTVDPSIPSTDRVLAEYFLLKGDEQRYLKTANIFLEAPSHRQDRRREYAEDPGHVR